MLISLWSKKVEGESDLVRLLNDIQQDIESFLWCEWYRFAY